MARALEIGAAAAAHELGLNPTTVRSWVRRSGHVPPAAERSTAQAETARAVLATVAQRKAQLADDLLDDAQALRAQLFAPCVERKAMTISDGHLKGAHVEIVDIELDQPAFADQRQIMTSIAIAVDKIQILTGEATERIETVTGRRAIEADALVVVDELAARRAS